VNRAALGQVANSKVERLRRSGGGGGGDAEELEAMRTLLRCNVCHERQKDVIITKCWHIFCSHCIRKNLETRNRKCPGCGAAFGQHDVKQFFFT
jgi:E3 ubiquitin-protein ligase BRE1